MTDSPTFSLTSTTQANSDNQNDKSSNAFKDIPLEPIGGHQGDEHMKVTYRKRTSCLSWFFCVLALIFLGTTLAAVLAWAVFTDGFKDLRNYQKPMEPIVINMTRVIEKVVERSYETADAPVCNTEGCVAIAADILKYMDTSLDPCQDFYDFACSKYEQEAVEDYQVRTKISDIYDTAWDKIKLILEADTPGEDSESDNFVKTFYSSCINDTARAEAGHKPLIDVFQSLSAWPFLNPDDSFEDVSIEKLIANLQLQYGVAVIIPVDTELNIEAFDHPLPAVFDKPYSLVLNAVAQPLISKMAMQQKDVNVEYRRLKTALVDLLVSLDIPNDDLEMRVDEILDFELRLANGYHMMDNMDKNQPESNTWFNGSNGLMADEWNYNSSSMFGGWNMSRNNSMMDGWNASYAMLMTDANYSMMNMGYYNMSKDYYLPHRMKRRRRQAEIANATMQQYNVTSWNWINITNMTNDTDTPTTPISITNVTATPMSMITKQKLEYYLSLDELKNVSTKVDWDTFFSLLIGNLTGEDKIWLGTPRYVHVDSMKRTLNYYKQLGNTLESTDKRIILNFIFMKISWSLLEYLPYRYQTPRIDFLRSGQYLAGCQQLVDSVLPGPLGALFVRTYFGEQTKDEISSLVQDIRKSMKIRLENADWMDQKTRMYALDKLRKMKSKIGAPEWIRNDTANLLQFTDVNMLGDQFFSNYVKIRGSHTRDDFLQLKKVEHGLDDYWHPPQTVNAFYSESNALHFPAGIIQFPEFVPGVPKYVNYGRFGHIIGHEITHGFDIAGAWENGSSWWAAETWKMFEDRVSCLSGQYDQEQFADTQYNANLTQQEDVADNGGLRIAYEAYQLWLRNVSGTPEQTLPGFTNRTNDQTFFIAFATNYCEKAGKMYDDEVRWYEDDHSIGRYRVNIPLFNFVPFVDAFQCPVNSKMNPDKKCVVW